jgi:hypothetical protein
MEHVVATWLLLQSRYGLLELMWSIDFIFWVCVATLCSFVLPYSSKLVVCHIPCRMFLIC